MKEFDQYLEIVIIAIIIAGLGFLFITVLLFAYRRFMEWGFSQLEYKRYFTKEGAFEGETVYFVEEMTNGFFLAFKDIAVESHISSGIKLSGCTGDDKIQHFVSIFSLKPRTRVVRRHKAVCMKRGHYVLESARIGYGDKDVFINSKHEFNVYPKETPIEQQESLNMYLQYSNYSKYPIVEDAFSVNGIREYGYGDAMSKINHKATAKAGKMMVNVNDYVLGRRVMVYLNFQVPDDTYIPMEMFEVHMENALSYVSYLIGECARCGFDFGFACNSRMAYGGRSAKYPISSGNGAYIDILNILACARPIEGDSILPSMDKDISENLTNAEIFFFTLKVDEAIDRRLVQLENMGNVVTVIRIDEV